MLSFFSHRGGGNIPQRGWTRFVVVCLLAAVFLGTVGVGVLVFPKEAHAEEGPRYWSPYHAAQALGNWALGTIGEGVVAFFEWLIAYIYSGTAWFLMGASSIFQGALEFTLSPDNYDLAGIKTAWTVIRDVVNIAFIFILLYVALMTVLQSSSFGTNRLLAALVLAALLVNFSFFFTRVVIDVGNTFAVTLYNIAAPGPEASIGQTFADRLNIQTSLASATNVNTCGASSGSDSGPAGLRITAYLLGIVTTSILALSFLTVALLVVGRTIALILLIIVSPAAFVAGILDKTRGYFGQWWGMLINNALFPFVYLLFILIALKITEELHAVFSMNGKYWCTVAANVYNNQAGSSSFLTSMGNQGYMDIVVFYLIVIGLINVATYLAKKMSAQAGALAVSYGGRAAGVALGAGAATLAFGGRHVMGRMGEGIASKKTLQDNAARGGFKGFAAKTLLRGGDTLKRSTFDARNSGFAQKMVGAAASGVGTKIDMGKGGKDTLAKYREKQVKDVERTMGLLGKGPVGDERREKLAGHYSGSVVGKMLAGRGGQQAAVKVIETAEMKRLPSKNELAKQKADLQTKYNGAKAGADVPGTAAILAELEKVSATIKRKAELDEKYGKKPLTEEDMEKAVKRASEKSE